MNKIDIFIDKLFEEAKKSGIAECESYYEDGNSFRVMVHQGEVAEYSVNATSGLSFRAMINGHVGYSYTEAFDDEAIKMLVKQSRENAETIETNDTQFIFEGSEKYEDIKTYNKSLDEVTPEEKIDLALSLEVKCLEKDERIKSVAYCLVQTGSHETIIKNSKGLNLSYEDNMAVVFVMPVATEGDVSYDGSEVFATRDFSKINADDIVGKAVDKALERFNAKSVSTGNYDIVFDYDCAGDMLSTFSGMFSAESAQKGLSLLAGKEGKKIASDIVTIMDDPWLEFGFNTTPFDDEGVATYKKAIVENGVLKTLLHNLKTANKANVKTTGNGSKGSYSSPVKVAPFNFYVEPGKNSVEELMEEVGDGLLITSLDGLHVADSVSCDFSLAASGFKIENGKKTTPVEQITVSGNYYELLRKIVMIADDLNYELIQSSIACPSILVKDVSVAGA